MDTSNSNKTFKKKSHRPWNPDLLENTVKESSKLTLPYGEPTEATGRLSNLPDNYNADAQLETIQRQLQNIISQKYKEHSEIEHKISNKTEKSMLIGGFFSPQEIASSNNSNLSDNGKNISHLLSDLELKKQELNNLNNNLKMTEALEKAENEAIRRKAEERSRLVAEEKMKQAIDQAHIAAEQLQIAINQTQQAERLQKNEEQARITAETEIKAANAKAIEAHQLSQNFEKAKQEAEIKAQHALEQTVQAELARQESENHRRTIEKQLQNTLDQLHKTESARANEQRIREELETKLQSLEIKLGEEKSAKANHENTIKQLEIEKNELTSYKTSSSTELESTKEELSVIKNKNAKLHKIIESEQELRLTAEAKAKNAIDLAAKAEKLQREAEIKMRQFDDRAKRAVAHASETVMHFLNAPLDDSSSIALKQLKDKIEDY